MVMQQIGTSDDEVKRAAVMEREKRLRGLILLGGRSDYTPAEVALLNVPFVCCSYSTTTGRSATRCIPPSPSRMRRRPTAR